MKTINKQKKERILVTLNSIGDGVITTDVDGRIELLNPVAEQLTGWSHEEAEGYPLDAVFNIRNEITGLPVQNPGPDAMKRRIVNPLQWWLATVLAFSAASMNSYTVSMFVRVKKSG